jgi:hypothetical protein
MNIHILDSFLHGTLKPWLLDFRDIKAIGEKLRRANEYDPDSMESIKDILFHLLSDQKELIPILESINISTELNLPYYNVDLPVAFDLPSTFISKLINVESLRYFNEVLSNPFITDPELDIPFQIGEKCLKPLLIIMEKTKESLEEENLDLSERRSFENITHFTLVYLHNTAVSLYFSIQHEYLPYLNIQYQDESDLFLYKFGNVDAPVTLIKSNNGLATVPKTKNTQIIGKKLSFGFSGDQEKLKSIIKLLCLHYSFLNESLCTQDQFITLFTSKDLLASTKEVHLSCPTNLFTATIEHFKKIAPKFNYANIDKSGSFYSQDGTLLNQKLLSNSEKQSKLSEEIKTRIASFFS